MVLDETIHLFIKFMKFTSQACETLCGLIDCMENTFFHPYPNPPSPPWGGIFDKQGGKGGGGNLDRKSRRHVCAALQRGSLMAQILLFSGKESDCR